jgi:hypothetical protein
MVMYKKTTPQQELFGVGTQLSPSLRSRIESSWAHLFKFEVLPILFKNEDRYAMLYGRTGRPNYSVARLLGLCLLQELNNLSDQQALDTFSFDIRWRYALDVSDEEDYLSRRSLVEFRRRLAAKDPEMKLVRNVFDHIRDSAIKTLVKGPISVPGNGNSVLAYVEAMGGRQNSTQGNHFQLILKVNIFILSD